MKEHGNRKVLVLSNEEVTRKKEICIRSLKAFFFEFGCFFFYIFYQIVGLPLVLIGSVIFSLAILHSLKNVYLTLFPTLVALYRGELDEVSVKQKFETLIFILISFSATAILCIRSIYEYLNRQRHFEIIQSFGSISFILCRITIIFVINFLAFLVLFYIGFGLLVQFSIVGVKRTSFLFAYFGLIRWMDDFNVRLHHHMIRPNFLRFSRRYAITKSFLVYRDTFRRAVYL